MIEIKESIYLKSMLEANQEVLPKCSYFNMYYLDETAQGFDNNDFKKIYMFLQDNDSPYDISVALTETEPSGALEGPEAGKQILKIRENVRTVLIKETKSNRLFVSIPTGRFIDYFGNRYIEVYPTPTLLFLKTYTIKNKPSGYNRYPELVRDKYPWYDPAKIEKKYPANRFKLFEKFPETCWIPIKAVDLEDKDKVTNDKIEMEEKAERQEKIENNKSTLSKLLLGVLAFMYLKD